MSEGRQTAGNRLEIAKQKLREQTRAWRGIEGLGSDGSRLRIYVSDQSLNTRIPPTVDGIEVVIVPSGKIQAQAI